MPPDSVPLRSLRQWREGPVAVIALSRPGAGNSIDESLAFELKELSGRLDQDEAVRVVVLTGDGDAFCGGTDPSAEREALRRADGMASLRVAGAVSAIKKPVIASIDGPAVDQGLELALACDLRIAAGRSTFALTQLERGLIPWDGGTQRLPRVIGASRALEMVLTCRCVDAAEALSIGLVGEIAGPEGPLERALEIAGAIARHGPIAARYLKEAVMKGLDLTMEQGLRLEADLNVILQSTADRQEGLRSFRERRAPGYTGE